MDWRGPWGSLKFKHFASLIFAMTIILGLRPFMAKALGGEINGQVTQNTPLKIVYCNYMPLYFEGINGIPRGILVDFWKVWSKKVDIPVTFTQLPWDQALEAVKTDDADIIAMIYHSRTRDAFFDFSQSILSFSSYLYHATDPDPSRDSASPVSPDTFPEKEVGIVTADFAMEYLKTHHPNTPLRTYPDHESLIVATLKGEIDAFVMEDPVASTYIAKHDALDRIKKNPIPLYTKAIRAGVKKGNQALVELINKGFSDFTAKEVDTIVGNWTARPHLTSTWQEKSHKKPLLIVTSLDNIPFHFMDEQGHAAGLLVDLWRLWSQKSGIPIQFTSAPWSESLAMVKTGTADIHAGCFYSSRRDTYLDYSNPLRVNCETHFFFHESIFGLKQPEDLMGFKIGLLKQDYAVEFIHRELPDAALVQYGSHRALIDGVEKGEVKVFISDTPVALYLLAEKHLLHTFGYHVSTPLYRKPFYAAVKEGNTALLTQINQGLKAITPKERTAIERRWMGASDRHGEDHLIVALSRSLPPFSMFSANGRPSGMLIDLWNSWSRQSGTQVEFRLFDTIDGINALKDGIVDILSIPTPEVSMEGWSSFSDPFCQFKWHLFVISENTNLEGLTQNQFLINRSMDATTDLTGLGLGDISSHSPPSKHPITLGIVKDTPVFNWFIRLTSPATVSNSSGKKTSSHSPLEKRLIPSLPGEIRIQTPHYGEFLIQGFETSQEMILAAESEKIDAFLGIPQEISTHLSRLGVPGRFKMVKPPFLEQPGMAAVRNYNPDLIRRINQGFQSIPDEIYTQIKKKWLISRFDSGFDAKFIRSLLLKVTLGGILIILLFIFWNRQIRQREKVLRQAREVAESANRAKSEFLAGLSHEVRTPLNAIFGMTELTLQSATLDPKEVKNLHAVKAAARHLLGIINDILDLSTLDAGKMHINPIDFDLDKLLDELHHTYCHLNLVRTKELEIRLKPSHTRFGIYHGDPIKLRQILANLLDNAVKFTAKGSIQIKVDLSPISAPIPKRVPNEIFHERTIIHPVRRQKITEKISPNEMISFTIQDTGIGIPREKQEIIFESFTQAEGSTTRKYGGTGLGLAISREMAGLMGGTIQLESEPGKGSRFSLMLPLQKIKAPPPTDLTVTKSLPKKNKTSARSPLNILLVEDCSVNAEVAREYFELLGHHVFVAAEGNKAMEILRQKKVEMIFMDIEMPDMDGLTVTHHIRNGHAGEKNRGLPIIAMSAHVLEEYRVKSRQAGMDDFLPKPVDLPLLDAMIERHRDKIGRNDQPTSCHAEIESGTINIHNNRGKLPTETKNERIKPLDNNALHNDSPDISDATEPPSLSVLDESEALRLFARNADLLKRVYGIFLQETPPLIEKLQQAMATQDRDTLKLASHTLKGACRRICAMRAAHHFQHLESASPQEAWETVEKKVATALSEVEKVIIILKNR